MSKDNYMGLAIGPIYDTFGQVRTTREIWVASYLFSHLMEQIARSLAGRGARLLVPALRQKKAPLGAGLYPDRLVFQPEGLSFEQVQDLLKDERHRLGKKIYEGLALLKQRGVLEGDFPEEEVTAQIDGFLKTYLAQVPAAEGQAKAASDSLDTLEIFPRYSAAPRRNYLLEMLAALKENRKAADLVIASLFQESAGILSIGEISTQGLRAFGKKEYKRAIKHWKRAEQKNEPEADTLMELLKKDALLGKHFRTHHKYVAVVQADGDNIGATLKALGDKGESAKFSALLYGLAEEAVKRIKKYGGLPVYAGGDDLLFFAPVAGKKNDTILNLIDGLSQAFSRAFEAAFEEWEREIEGFERPPQVPSLSFGLSISYYKFPMAEAIEASYDLLQRAKDYPEEKDKQHKLKNALAMRVLKHSGHSFENVFYLKEAVEEEETLFGLFKKLLDTALEGEEAFLNSVIYFLGKNKKVLATLARDDAGFGHFFKNSLDEDVHEASEGYISAVRQLLGLSFRHFKEAGQFEKIKAEAEQPDGNPEKINEAIEKITEAALTEVYGLLRAIHFLKRKDNE